MKNGKPHILILTDFYLPGYKSGGAVRTLVNTIERLGDEFEFSVVTRNHDGWGDFTPYKTIKTGEWNSIGTAQVFYFGSGEMSLAKLQSFWTKVEPDTVFLVSFFSDLCAKALTLRRLKRISNAPFVFAPQGELAPGALEIKARKKKVFLAIAKRIGLYRGIIWKASAEEEKRDIEATLGKRSEIIVAPDLSPPIFFQNYSSEMKPPKRAGEARFGFLSRVNRKKNLSFVLKAIRHLRGEIVFDVFGAHDDETYWRECEILIQKLPSNVKIEIHGSIDYEAVAETMSRFHFFVLPTLGENFGHVVLEAMASGCPVLLSDRTPWRGLEEKGIGWDLSLEEPDKWWAILQECVDLPQADFALMSAAARMFAVEWFAAPEVEALNRETFRRAIAKYRTGS